MILWDIELSNNVPHQHNKGVVAGAKGERGDGVVAVAAGLEKIGLELGVKKPRKHVLVGQVKI
jgi:hypothetical protein